MTTPPDSVSNPIPPAPVQPNSNHEQAPHPHMTSLDIPMAPSSPPPRRDFGSPEILRRAGLLHPMAQSYNSTSAFPPPDHIPSHQADSNSTNHTDLAHPQPGNIPITRRIPHSQDTIRENTVQLSNMVMVSSPPLPTSIPTFVAGPNTKKYIFPTSPLAEDIPYPQPDLSPRDPEDNTSLSSLLMDFPSDPGSLSSSIQESGLSTDDERPHPSGLSILLRSRGPSPDISDVPTPKDLVSPAFKPFNEMEGDSTITGAISPQTTPRAKPTRTLSLQSGLSTVAEGYGTTGQPQFLPTSNAVTDRTPLLSIHGVPGYSPHSSTLTSSTPHKDCSLHSLGHNIKIKFHNVVPKETFTAVNLKQKAADTGSAALRAVPAVILGCLLNILDGLSYGMIAFPSAPPFQNESPSLIGFDGASTGVSMFFLTTVVSQLVYTLGGSGFAGANGSMMIEVVPFFHILGMSIAKSIGFETEEQQRTVVATTMASFLLSSLLTGITFFTLGAFKLGAIIGFFPRHILVGCIGGIGLFLIETGFTVSRRLSDDEFGYNWPTLQLFFSSGTSIALWTTPLALAIFLRLITAKWNHQLLLPIYFLIIPMIFYIVVAAARLNLSDLRDNGWVFDVGVDPAQKAANWYSFYSYLDVKYIHARALWDTLPTQLALLFFNILHPPLNVPALSVSLNQDIDTNKELVAHGYSNFIAGLIGTVPNYLVYVNTLLFYRVGGGKRIAGFMLAIATFVLLCIGTGPISFIPVMVVGALIFVLGIDLVKEALWDTRHRVTRLEYITIISIMVFMTVWDFVIGVLFGIVMSCFFFVVQNSQRRSIRAFHTGETVMSTVRRPTSQREYIREVSKQTMILKLQGFLFFGTITYVEQEVRNALEGPAWIRNPVRFLIVDLSLVGGVDMSAAEAFVRIQRLLSARCVTLVFCGFKENSPIGHALASVEVLGAEGVELFSAFNDAMEWTENAYLRAWFRSQKAETTAFVLPGRQDADIQTQQSLGTFVGSPRLSHLHNAGKRTIAQDLESDQSFDSGPPEPFNSLVKAFSSFDVKFDGFRLLANYFERVIVPENHVLWNQGDSPDGLYLIESGILRATYHFAENTQSIEESMVPGTLAGELSALSGLHRNATTVAERQAVLWRITMASLGKMQAENAQLAQQFIELVVKSAKVDYDILLCALATRQ